MCPRKLRGWSKWRTSSLGSRKTRRRSINLSLFRLIRTSFLITMLELTPENPIAWKISIEDSNLLIEIEDILRSKLRKVCRNLMISGSKRSQKHHRNHSRHRATSGREDNAVKSSSSVRGDSQSQRLCSRTWWSGTRTTSSPPSSDLSNMRYDKWRQW